MEIAADGALDWDGTVDIVADYWDITDTCYWIKYWKCVGGIIDTD